MKTNLNMSSVILLVSLGLIAACETTPLAVVPASHVMGPVRGEACSTQYLGFIDTGDSTIPTAAQNAGISEISYVESRNDSVLGMMTTHCTEVWGHSHQTKAENSPDAQSVK